LTNSTRSAKEKTKKYRTKKELGEILPEIFADEFVAGS